MNLQCEIAGWSTTWRFKDSGWLERWLDGAPWNGGTPAAQVLRLSDATYRADVMTALRRGFTGLTAGDTAARLREVQLGAGDGVDQAVAHACGLGTLSRLEDKLELARELALAPTLLVLTGSTRDRALAGEVNALLDLCAKWNAQPRVAVVVLDTMAEPSIGAPRDLATGWFADPVMQAIERPARHLERLPYLALRLAWEVGGDFGYLLAESRRWTSIPGDDVTLEQELNGLARRRWSEIPGPLQQEFRSWMGALGTAGLRLGERRSRSPGGSLREARLVWRPPGQSSWRPVPWVARALLLAGGPLAGSPFLRACLVAVPLANEVLRRCFELESLVVSGVTAACGDGGAPQDARDLFSAFGAGNISERQLYPRTCPAVPTNAWAFASFGAVIKNRLDDSGSPCIRLRNLRNALSHGHYVSWYAIQELFEIEAALRL